MNEKTKPIFAIMLIISALSGIFLYWGIHLYQKTMDDKIVDTIEKTDLLINEAIKDSSSIYDLHIDNLIANKNILSTFKNRDRKGLYRSVLPFHNKLKADNPYYSNLHFHLPSGQSFLRLHKPNEFGDDLRQLRPIIMKVHKTRLPVFGYEIGKHGLFYRIAKPVFYDGIYIGALEIGIKAEKVAQKIDTMLNIKVARVIDDHLLNDGFRGYRKSEIETQNVYVNPFRNQAFFSELAPDYNFKKAGRQFFLMNGRNIVAYTSGNFNDFNGRAIARFLIAQDITDEMEGYRFFLKRSVGLTLILIAGAYTILHFSFGSYINKIIELNKTLEKRVKERTRDLEMVTEKLQVTNSELNQIFNTAADGMRVIDKKFNVLRVNDTFVKLAGVTKEALLTSLCHDHFRGEFCFSTSCTLNRILGGENRLEVDVERTTLSGEKKSFLLTATPFKSSDGTILGVVENFKDITNRKKVFNALEENEQYLNSIMATVQAGVIITDDKSPRIIDVNPYAAKLIGRSRKELKQSSIREFFRLERPLIENVMNSQKIIFEPEDCILTTASGEKRNIRLSVARAQIRGKTYLVQSFSDITDVKLLVEKQLVDIHKAKSVMDLINPWASRHIKLRQGSFLFTDSVSIPCNAEGGDHLFIRHFPDVERPRTVISLKDQSGHEVNCILRSIYTDLIHNAVLLSSCPEHLGNVITRLNTILCQSDFFDEDDFFTSITFEIDHQSLMLDYLLAGHPPFLLIRDGQAQLVPGQDSPVSVYNLPIPFLKDAQYISSQLQLRQGDQLIFYTDGLTEMPMKNLGSVISPEDLKSMVQKIMDHFHVQCGKSMPVSALTEKLLQKIATASQATVIPEQGGTSPVNTSSDDVSIIGVEIEPAKDMIEKIFYPENAQDISDMTRTILDLIFQAPENRNFDHMQYRMKMILEEAVINAWQHGNRMDPEKSITIRFSSRNDFFVEILDQGSGFDFSNLPDPRSEENIEKQSGRGLFIIRHFSDQVLWERNGTHILICIQKRKQMDDRQDLQKQQCRIRLWEMKQTY